MNQPKDIKVVFIDLDGTLLYHMDRVSERNIQAIRRIQEKGVRTVIATGRPAYETDFAVQATGSDTYLITMNGVTVYQDYKTRTLLYEAYMQNRASKQIIAYLLKQQVFFEAYIGERAYYPVGTEVFLRGSSIPEDKIQFFLQTAQPIEDIQHICEKQLHISKFFFAESRPERIAAMRDALGGMNGVRTLQSSDSFVEVLPDGMDKKRAVHAVRTVLGLTPEQIMVIGDSENDMGMFEEAGTCVAMGNAFARLKEKADYIAPTNEQDGVAWALETLILREQTEHLAIIEPIYANEIEDALTHSTRQYLTGNLKLPQELRFIRDTAIESGISSYPAYKWEQPHYHTVTSEYCYILAGETKYVNLSTQEEYHFKAGDFYVLRRDVPYLQKCQAGCRLFFVKAPGINDKVSIELTQKMKDWCSDWNATWICK